MKSSSHLKTSKSVIVPEKIEKRWGNDIIDLIITLVKRGSTV